MTSNTALLAWTIPPTKMVTLLVIMVRTMMTLSINVGNFIHTVRTLVRPIASPWHMRRVVSFRLPMAIRRLAKAYRPFIDPNQAVPWNHHFLGYWRICLWWVPFYCLWRRSLHSPWHVGHDTGKVVAPRAEGYLMMIIPNEAVVYVDRRVRVPLVVRVMDYSDPRPRPTVPSLVRRVNRGLPVVAHAVDRRVMTHPRNDHRHERVAPKIPVAEITFRLICILEVC